LSRSRPVLAALLLVWAAACSGLGPWPGARPSAVSAPDRIGDEGPGAGDGGVFDSEEEEIALEDPDALGALISGLLHAGTDGGPEDEGPVPVAAAEVPPAEVPPGGIVVPVAFDTWSLADDECLALVEEAGIETRRPDFPTPLVRTPLLLEGPIEGVEIVSRWPRKARPVNAVMDCRLVVALVAVAREAKRGGFSRVLFYSTYRPLEPPPEKCEEGKAGAACRKAKRRYERTLAGPSQHRRALAIDIHAFARPDGSMVEVLEDYERHDDQPPCADEPRTEVGRFLKELACALHEQKAFSVVLTPNANKAHHNHFHFDITPRARWYIVR
jgi:hypothetical protein